MLFNLYNGLQKFISSNKYTVYLFAVDNIEHCLILDEARKNHYKDHETHFHGTLNDNQHAFEWQKV